jgi:hypothetical protein
MGLSNSKEEQLRKQPIIETFVRKSEDGKYMITKTVFTYIKPTAYYEAVLSGTAKEEEEPLVA